MLASIERHGFALLAGLAIVGTALELAAERHWDGAVQLVPWAAIAVVAAALVLHLLRRTPAAVRTVRAAAALVGASSVFGVYEHVRENYVTAPLDVRYTDRWPTMSATSKWWHALSKAVGPAPTLAPGVLALAALCLLLATVRRTEA